MRSQKIGGGGSPVPAQVRFQMVHDFPPLPESKFRKFVTYKAPNQFDFLLSPEQAMRQKPPHSQSRGGLGCALAHCLSHPRG